MEEFYLNKNGVTAILYYDRPDNDERVNFYDENKELLDCIYGDDEKIKQTIEKLNQKPDFIDVFAYFCPNFDYGKTLKECLQNYIETWFDFSEIQEEIEKDIEAIEALETTETELLSKYDINKIGNMYFKGDWS